MKYSNHAIVGFIIGWFMVWIAILLVKHNLSWLYAFTYWDLGMILSIILGIIAVKIWRRK